MMVVIPGTVAVFFIERHARVIKSAILRSSIGMFHVKYHHLDKMQEGEHEGSFRIAKIHPHCREFEGRHLFELAAVVDDMFFSGASFNSYCES